MNLPNKLTIVRMILLIPIMLFLVPLGEGRMAEFVASNSSRIIAIALFIIASLTDFIDGKIARKHNLVTDFGKLMDPIADKLLVLAVFIAMAELGRVSSILVLIILARELLVTGIRQVGASKGVVIQAGKFGKWKAATQMLTLIYLMLEPLLVDIFSASLSSVQLWGNILLAVTIVMTVASGLDYYLKYRHLFKSA